MFKEQLLKGKSGIITGGSSGIGLMVAELFSSLGAGLTLCGRNGEKLKEAKNRLSGEVLGVSADVRKGDEVDALVEKHVGHFGKVDFLINNAAGNFLCPLENMSENAFRSVNDIVTLGTFLTSKAVFPHMKIQGRGTIINTGTTYAYGHGALVGHSGAAKAAVMNLTKTMAVEWGPYGICCNMVAPGPVKDTEGVRRLMGAPELAGAMMQSAPIARMAEGVEVAELMVFLMEARYINGAVIPIDGGIHLNCPGLLPSHIVEEVKRVLPAKV